MFVVFWLVVVCCEMSVQGWLSNSIQCKAVLSLSISRSRQSSSTLGAGLALAAHGGVDADLKQQQSVSQSVSQSVVSPSSPSPSPPHCCSSPCLSCPGDLSDHRPPPRTLLGPRSPPVRSCSCPPPGPGPGCPVPCGEPRS